MVNTVTDVMFWSAEQEFNVLYLFQILFKVQKERCVFSNNFSFIKHKEEYILIKLILYRVKVTQ